MKFSDIAVVIPTYNNNDTIYRVIEDVHSYGYEIIVVDDGSKIPIKYDKEFFHIVKHSQNRGKGEALKSGAKEAKRLGFKYFVSIDGDGQHLASEIEKLIEVVTKERQIIIGVRNFNINNVPLGSKIGRWFSNIWIEIQTFKKLPILSLALDSTLLILWILSMREKDLILR